MWEGQLCRFSIAKIRVEVFAADAKTSHSAWYWMDSRAREFGKTKIGKLLLERAITLAWSECANPTVFMAKENIVLYAFASTTGYEMLLQREGEVSQNPSWTSVSIFLERPQDSWCLIGTVSVGKPRSMTKMERERHILHTTDFLNLCGCNLYYGMHKVGPEERWTLRLRWFSGCCHLSTSARVWLQIWLQINQTRYVKETVSNGLWKHVAFKRHARQW